MTGAAEALTTTEKRELLRKLLARRQDSQPAEYPLSYGQQALWFLHRLAPGMASYNFAITAAATPPLNVRAFEAAVRWVIQRHSALSSVIAEGESGPVHKVRAEFPVPFSFSERDNITAEEVHADYARPFDLTSELPFRASVYRDRRTDVMLLVAHHIAFDAGSAQLLFDDLERGYTALLNHGAPPELPPPGSYAGFVRWERQHLASAQGQSLRDYWRRQLSAPLPVLGIGARSAGLPSHQGGSIPVDIDAALLGGLRQIGREQKATLFTLMVLLWAVLMNRLTGCTEVIVGTPVSARTRPEWTGTIGYFINLLPLRVRVDSGQSFRAQVSEVVETVLQGLAHQDLPFPLMVDQLRIRRSSTSPVFQTLVNVQRVQPHSRLGPLFGTESAAAPLEFGGSRLTPFPLRQLEGQFDLALELAECAHVARGQIKFSNDVLDRSRAEEIARQFMTVLRAAIAQPDTPIQSAVSAASERDEFVF